MKNVLKQRIIWMTIIFSAGILSILILHQTTMSINSKPNGFIRLYPPHLLTPKNILNLEYNSYYIAGATSQKIYLGNSSAPNILFSTNYLLEDTITEIIHYAGRDSMYIGGARLTVDSPYVFVMEGRSPILYWGTLDSLVVFPVKDSIRFYSGIPLSPNKYIIRVPDKLRKQNTLAIRQFNPVEFSKTNNTLQKQIDGVFCTDGDMFFDRNSNRIVYIYYYRNQFLCMDTSLNVIYTGRTKDTISMAKIKVTTIQSEGLNTTASPSLLVNKEICISDNKIFVHSMMKANNENSSFEKMSPIDVFSLSDGKYLYSIRIPNYNKIKVSQIRVYNRTLFARYEQYLISYELKDKS